jgi:hypothetical protein
MRLARCSAHPKGRGSPKNANRLRAYLFARVGRLHYLDRTCSEIPTLPDESAARPGEIARLRLRRSCDTRSSISFARTRWAPKVTLENAWRSHRGTRTRVRGQPPSRGFALRNSVLANAPLTF